MAPGILDNISDEPEILRQDVVPDMGDFRLLEGLVELFEQAQARGRYLKTLHCQPALFPATRLCGYGRGRWRDWRHAAGQIGEQRVLLRAECVFAAGRPPGLTRGGRATVMGHTDFSIRCLVPL